MSSLLVSPSAFDADRALTMDEARARFDERYPEFRNKALWFFRVKCRLSRDWRQKAAANAIFLAWHYVRSLVNHGKCTDRTMTGAFYFALKHTVDGRRLHGERRTHYIDVFDLARHPRCHLLITG